MILVLFGFGGKVLFFGFFIDGFGVLVLLVFIDKNVGISIKDMLLRNKIYKYCDDSLIILIFFFFRDDYCCIRIKDKKWYLFILLFF